MLRILLLLIVLISTTLACDYDSIAKRLDLLPSTTPSAGNVSFFSDDFSNRTTQSWRLGANSNSKLAIEDGGFKFEVLAPAILAWSTTGRNFRDVEVDVDAEKKDGPDTGEYGILCRYSLEEDGTFNFYYFVVSGDQSASIMKIVRGQQTELTDRKVRFDEVKMGNAVNHITARCVGSELTLLINHAEIIVIADGAFEEGDVGLIVSTMDEGGMQVEFDNFVAAQP